MPTYGVEHTFKSLLLPNQIRLRRVGNRHIACVHCQTIILPGGWHIVMWGSAVPDDQVARFDADLFPLQAVVLEPFHAVLSEPEPLFRPGGDTWLVGHLAVELLRELVAAFAHDEATIVGSTGV